MRKLDSRGKLDGYGHYLYGVVLRKLDLMDEALAVLLKAVEETPLHWGAWLELSSLINDKDALKGLQLPDHWIRFFFMAYAYLELQLNEQALTLYQELSKVGFAESTHVVAQVSGFRNSRFLLPQPVIDSIEKSIKQCNSNVQIMWKCIIPTNLHGK